MEFNDFEMTNASVSVEDVPIWHDQKDKYKVLETFLCVLEEGCGFGELAMNM